MYAIPFLFYMESMNVVLNNGKNGHNLLVSAFQLCEVWCYSLNMKSKLEANCLHTILA